MEMFTNLLLYFALFDFKKRLKVSLNPIGKMHDMSVLYITATLEFMDIQLFVTYASASE